MSTPNGSSGGGKYGRHSRWATLNESVRRQPGRATLLALLLLLLVGAGSLWVYYLRTRQPLANVLPPAPAVVAQVFEPRYLFSVHDVRAPIGVAVTPPGDRIYVTESHGERLVRAFDRDGAELFSFSPPGTTPASRAPVYVDLDNQGNVYVTDRLQHAIYVYTADGQYLDTILAPGVRLRDWARSVGGPEYAAPGVIYIYLFGQTEIQVHGPDGNFLDPLPAPDYTVWSPLGINVDDDAIYVTELTRGSQRLMILDVDDAGLRLEFGSEGQEPGQFNFPNDIALDGQGRIFVADSNNGRLQMVSPQGELLSVLNLGAGGSRLGMPRGTWIDDQARLYVVDTMSHEVYAYDMNQNMKPLFSFGGHGLDDGQFNFPNDLSMDNTGRLYVTDTYNNRVQVWTY